MKISVASPCKRDWNKMTGDDRSRYCSDCKLNVYNLSAMSQAELDDMVKQKEGRVCVRFFSRPDGTVLTRDCPVGLTRKRRTYAFSMAALASLIAAPFFVRGEECSVTGESEPTLVEAVRELVYDVKVKLGLAPPRMTHTVGMMIATPPPAPPSPPAAP